MNLFMILWNLFGFRFEKLPQHYIVGETFCLFTSRLLVESKGIRLESSLHYWTALQQTQPSWCRCQDLNPDYFGGRRILSPLHHPTPLEQDYAIASSSNESYCTPIHVWTLRVSEISLSIIVAPKHKFLMLKVVVAGRGEIGWGPKELACRWQSDTTIIPGVMGVAIF